MAKAIILEDRTLAFISEWITYGTFSSRAVSLLTGKVRKTWPSIIIGTSLVEPLNSRKNVSMKLMCNIFCCRHFFLCITWDSRWHEEVFFLLNKLNFSEIIANCYRRRTGFTEEFRLYSIADSSVWQGRRWSCRFYNNLRWHQSTFISLFDELELL